MKINCKICSSGCNSCSIFESKPMVEELVLVKKKVSSHYVPPDMAALKLLCESPSASYQEMSDQELESLKREILLEIKKQLDN